MKLKYPVYIISKGRWESRLTAKAFEKIKVPYRIVVEPQEFNKYAEVIDKNKILTLPFSNLGQGSIPARNWVWEHSIKEGHKRHWIVDDNIRNFRRYNNNKKISVSNGAIFRAMEDFTDRYTNVALSGPNYYFFIAAKSKYPPFYLNSRIYSCILIKNNLPFRWRGKYNEDTDLSLRVLKADYCTILFNTFLQEKTTTMSMKGGNTDEVYVDGDNRMKFAKSLVRQHPDLVKVIKRWGRNHHYVDYRLFKRNKLIKKKNIKIKKKTDNYGMKLNKVK